MSIIVFIEDESVDYVFGLLIAFLDCLVFFIDWTELFYKVILYIFQEVQK